MEGEALDLSVDGKFWGLFCNVRIRPPRGHDLVQHCLLGCSGDFGEVWRASEGRASK